ncbi:MAG: class I SAM-dependent methyltransferase [Candidatus Omnitrophica bacterium]|nr:class I SAM-dependent methyltransferase [Candidatus Omnitrophota bacterium]
MGEKKPGAWQRPMQKAFMTDVVLQIRKRLRLFKKYGYDLPASRQYFLKKVCFCKGPVLEIGTGKGHLTVAMAKRGLQVISLDSDPKQLAVARVHLKALKLSGYVRFKKMNAEKLRFKTQAFDSVVSMDFFHHAQKPLRCLKEMMRVTKRTLAIADLNKNGMAVMGRLHKSEGKTHEISKIPFRALREYLLKNGFKVKNFRHQCHAMIIAQRREL